MFKFRSNFVVSGVVPPEARTLMLGLAGYVAVVVKLGHSHWDRQAMLHRTLALGQAGYVTCWIG